MSHEEKEYTVMPEAITDEIQEEILNKTVDGKIECEVARNIAHRNGISTRSVGEALNVMHIKVHHCGLGCF